MDKITKFLPKPSAKERENILIILEKLQTWKLEELESTKLVWHRDTYRIRQGQIRIIFSTHWNIIKVINIDYRWHAYKNI
jgi:mRNA-degrading endonuclease RelE of RelBE toxin-antitoxin system